MNIQQIVSENTYIQSLTKMVSRVFNLIHSNTLNLENMYHKPIDVEYRGEKKTIEIILEYQHYLYGTEYILVNDLSDRTRKSMRKNSVKIL